MVVEMALALVLLAAGGLFLRGLDKFVERDLGWRLDGLLTARLDLPGPRGQGGQADVFVAELERRLAALPEVEASALAHHLPRLAGSTPCSPHLFFD